jgi:hypothetical protein
VSFRQTNNRQDTWQNYCDRHAAILAEIGLPMRTFASDRSLAELKILIGGLTIVKNTGS